MFNKITSRKKTGIKSSLLSLKNPIKIRQIVCALIAVIIAFSNSAQPASAIIYSDEELENILYYNPDANQNCGPAVGSSVPGSCAALGEARTAMWNSASERDRRRFMNVVVREDYGLAAVEAYMNQVISKYGGHNGTLSSWLGGQCVRFMAGGSSKCATEKANLTQQDQSLISMALGGSNVVGFALGNATGGSSVGAGKMTCIWKQDSSRPELGYCRDDVDLNQAGGTGRCSVYAPSASFGECWGLEGGGAWASQMQEQCASSSSTTPSDGTAATPGGTTGTSSGSLSGPAPTQLTGETNADKVWNYFIARGLTPVAAAGAMGNIEQESNFDPFLQEMGSGIGFGIIQWSFDRRASLEAAAAREGVSFVRSDENNDKALLFQLNYLWDGEYGRLTWQNQVNSESTVDGDASIAFSANNTGNGSTMVFHSLVERSGDGTAGKQERIDSAKAFLAKYGGSSSTNNCDIYGFGSVGEGGLTLEQAKQFMIRYGENVNGFSARQSGALWNMCNGGGSNCVTFSYFFNNAFTDLPAAPNDGNGNRIVSSLRAKGANGGNTPMVFSTFSWSGGTYGHTGIVLGIHGDQIIVGHASCGSSGRGPGDGTRTGGGSGFVLVGTLSDNQAFWGRTPSGFAYPGQVNTDAINQFINQGYVN